MATQQPGEKKFIDEGELIDKGVVTRVNCRPKNGKLVSLAKELKPVNSLSQRPKDTEVLPKMTVYNDSPEDFAIYTELADAIVKLNELADNSEATESAKKALDYVGKATAAFDSAKSSKKTGLAWISIHLNTFVQNSLGRYYQAKAKTALLEAMVAADPEVKKVEQAEAKGESSNAFITVDAAKDAAFEKAKLTLFKATLHRQQVTFFAENTKQAEEKGTLQSEESVLTNSLRKDVLL